MQKTRHNNLQTWVGILASITYTLTLSVWVDLFNSSDSYNSCKINSNKTDLNYTLKVVQGLYYSILNYTTRFIIKLINHPVRSKLYILYKDNTYKHLTTKLTVYKQMA